MAELEPLSDDERTALLHEFKRGADLIFGNAEQLFHEAEALKETARLPDHSSFIKFPSKSARR
ncbi:MAG: hypothetical protein ABI604_10070 [Nitrospirota bacterium]